MLSCALYDQLELNAMRQVKVKLSFKRADQNMVVVEALIADLFVREGKEYLLTDRGQEYSLDELVNIETL